MSPLLSSKMDESNPEFILDLTGTHTNTCSQSSASRTTSRGKLIRSNNPDPSSADGEPEGKEIKRGADIHRK